MTEKVEVLRLAEQLEKVWFQHEAAAELRRLHAERTAADGVINDLVAKVRKLQKENTSLSAALASSCDEQRHELWESGGIAGCERARVAERQRDTLLEACKAYDQWADKTFCYDRVLRPIRAQIRAAIKAVEEK